MSNANVIFTLDGIDVTVQCLPNEKMKDICQRYATKIQTNLNSLLFLYGGNKMNYELSFKDQINSIDKNNNIMKVLVYRTENDELKCPKCGEKININTGKIKDIISLNDNIKDTLIGIKASLENIINNKNTPINVIYIQLKNIIILFNNINEDIKKNNEKLQNLLNESITSNINEQLKNININNNIQIKTYDKGRYEGHLINDKREGKGIMYYNDGNRYEGEFKNDKAEGKGIIYYNKDDEKKREKYEGDFKNNKREGKGIYYYKNGDREMGNYLQGRKIGKHVTLKAYGDVTTNIYNN